MNKRPVPGSRSLHLNLVFAITENSSSPLFAAASPFIESVLASDHHMVVFRMQRPSATSNEQRSDRGEHDVKVEAATTGEASKRG